MDTPDRVAVPAVPFIEADEPLPAPSRRLGPDSAWPGLVAMGLDLGPGRLREAYAQGLFPWFSPGEPVLWWSTNPRMVLRPEAMRPSRSLRQSARRLRQAGFSLTVSTDFTAVMQHCAGPRLTRNGLSHGSWIHAPVLHAYSALHAEQRAQSLELRDAQGSLQAGLYGVHLGRVFYGESMFTRVTDGSKLLLWCLCGMCRALDIRLIDCQQQTRHLASLGATPIPADIFERELAEHAQAPAPGTARWREVGQAIWHDWGLLSAANHHDPNA